jgi:cation:H+ antiporter
MAFDIAMLVAGFAVLVFAGDFLVRGAVALSLRLGIPALIVSLTVVAFGTSAPELIIAIQSALEGVSELALGNVVGSNIANVWLVLGIPALINSITSDGADIKRSAMTMVFVTFLFIVLCFTGPFHYGHGFILLIVLALVLADTIRSAMNVPDIELPDELTSADPETPWSKIILFVLIGLIGLPLGAELLVRASVSIAQGFDVPEAVIGLTIVAIGTSLPELATTVMAAFRRQTDVALGNVIGSNMFNILAIMGVASFFGPIDVPLIFLEFDLWIMAAAALTLVPIVFFNVRLGKRWGIVFVLAYLLYIFSLLATHVEGAM